MRAPFQTVVAATLGLISFSVPAFADSAPSPADGWTAPAGTDTGTPAPPPEAAPAPAPSEAAASPGTVSSPVPPPAPPPEVPPPPALPYRHPGPALPTPVSVGPSAPTATPYDGPKLLFSDRKPSIGVYAGAGTSYSHMLHRDGVVVNGELALLVDHSLALGVGGAIFSRTPQGPDDAYGEPREFAASYGGLVLRYAVYAKDLPVYASLGVLVGGGAVALYEERDLSGYDGDDDFDGDFADDYEHDDPDVKPFLVAQPELFLHANATRWLRFGIGGGYRFASAVKDFGFEAKDTGGIVLGGNIHLGWL